MLARQLSARSDRSSIFGRLRIVRLRTLAYAVWSSDAMTMMSHSELRTGEGWRRFRKWQAGLENKGIHCLGSESFFFLFVSACSECLSLCFVFFCFLGFSRFKMQSFCSNALGLIHRGHSFESLVTTTTTADFDLRPLPASTGDRYRLRVIAPNTIDLLITISDRSSISGGLTHLHRQIEPRCSAKVRSESHSFCRFLPRNAG